MRSAVVVLPVLLSACVDPGQPPGDPGPRRLDVHGDLTIRLAIVESDVDCPTLAPRDPLVLTVDPESKDVTAAAPAALLDGTLVEEDTSASIRGQVRDEWQADGEPIEVVLVLDVFLDREGSIWGTGTTDLPSTCHYPLQIEGEYVPDWVPITDQDPE